MTKHLPTKVGDVLILQTKRTFTLSALGFVTNAGQQDFHHEAHVIHMPDHAAAVAHARARIARGGRIFVRDLDTDGWAKIAM